MSDDYFSVTRRRNIELQQTGVSDEIQKRLHISETDLAAAILDSIITDIATFRRTPKSSEAKRNYRKAKQYVESPSTEAFSFLWAVQVVANHTTGSDTILIVAFKKIVRLEILPSCVDPNTFRRTD